MDKKKSIDKLQKQFLLHEVFHGVYLSLCLFETVVDYDTYGNSLTEQEKTLIDNILCDMHKLYNTLGKRSIA